MNDAEAFDMLVQMGGGLSWNDQGGFWSCYPPTIMEGFYSDDDPVDCVRRAHAKWLSVGAPPPVKLSEAECELIHARIDRDEVDRKLGCSIREQVLASNVTTSVGNTAGSPDPVAAQASSSATVAGEKEVA